MKGQVDACCGDPGDCGQLGCGSATSPARRLMYEQLSRECYHSGGDAAPNEESPLSRAQLKAEGSAPETPR